MHRRLEHAVLALAVALADVHRRLGVADQLARIAHLADDPREGDRDADARAHEDVLAGDRDRRLEAADQPLHRIDGRDGIADALDQDRELVAAEARGRVGRARDLQQAGGDRLQHLVAHRVAEAVVDRLEVVEVEEDHGRA